MPHHKSAKKRVLTNEIRRQRNISRRSRMRHAIRDLRESLSSATAPGEQLQNDLQSVTRLLDRMVSKGLIHRNKAGRLKSRLIAQMPVS